MVQHCHEFAQAMRRTAATPIGWAIRRSLNEVLCRFHGVLSLFRQHGQPSLRYHGVDGYDVVCLDQPVLSASSFELTEIFPK
jgi:hypothetical protein